MRKIKLLDLIEASTITLGASGLILVGLGGTICLLGLSGKAVNKLAAVIKPYQSITQSLVNYGSGVAYTGLFLAGSGMLIAKTVGEALADADFAEEIKSNLSTAELNAASIGVTPSHHADNEELLLALAPTPNEDYCRNCIYASSSSYLPCAVNPDMPKDCQHFRAK